MLLFMCHMAVRGNIFYSRRTQIDAMRRGQGVVHVSGRCLAVWLLVIASIAPCAVASSAKTASPAHPCAEAAPAGEQRVLLQSETLEFFQQDNRVVATGNVILTQGNRRLFADQLEFSTVNNTGTAWGHVRLLTPNDDLQASRLDFDFNAERGVLYDASGKASRHFYLAGERIERVGAQSFRLQRGRVTACSNPSPEWQFRATEAQLDINEYVTMKNPTFWIKGIPVFYLPYFIFPAREKRTTGFLPPRLGRSEQFGNIFGEEFFWAINDWMDATVGVEYLSKAGFKPELEYRYAIDPQSDGQLRAAFLRDRETDTDLWRVLLQQRQDFGWGIRGLSQIDVRSETDLVRRFARTIEEESAIRTASFGALTKLTAFGGVTLTGASYDGIPESGTSQRFRYLPSLRLSQFPTALPLPVFFALETSYNQFMATDILGDTPVQRFDLFPRLILPLAWRPWVNATVTGGVHETVYDRRLKTVLAQGVSEGGSLSRLVPDVIATADGPQWRRRYTEVLAGQDLIHVITPRLVYRYVPAVQQKAIPPIETLNEAEHFLDPLETFTLVDRIRPANYAKLTLVNRLYAQATGPTGVRSVREVARLLVSQGVDLRQVSESSEQLAGPLDIELDFRVWPRWWLESVLRVAPATGVLQEAFWRTGINLWQGAALSVTNFQRQDPNVRYWLGSFQTEVLQGLRLSYNIRYDALASEVREHLVLLHYQGDCWRIDARFRLRQAGDTDFFVQVNLLSL